MYPFYFLQIIFFLQKILISLYIYFPWTIVVLQFDVLLKNLQILFIYLFLFFYIEDSSSHKYDPN